METASAFAVLVATEVLGQLPEDDLLQLSSIVRELRVSGGLTLYEVGEMSDACYIVMEGSVRFYLKATGGAEITMAIVGPHQPFGEMALLDGGPRAASARTLEATTLLEIPRGGWLDLVARHPPIGLHVLEIIGATVRRYAHYAAECLFLDLEGRVARVLVQLAERTDPIEEGAGVGLQPTQGQIATMIGGSRQSVNFALRGLEALGYVEKRGGSILITDPEGLLARSRV